MPLLLPNIVSELSKLMDKDNALFPGYPQNPASVASNWGTAIDNYAQLVIPASTTSAVAKAALITALTGAVAPGSFFPTFISALTTYATTLGGGMAGWVAVPPPAPIDFSLLLALPLNAPLATKINTLAGIIDTWFKTGSATLIAPPNTFTLWV